MNNINFRVRRFILYVLIFFAVSSDFAQINYDFSTKLQRANSLFNSRKFTEAKDLFEKLNRIQPLNTNIITSLNNVYLQLKDYNKSILFLNSKIALSPNNINYYGLLGNSYFIKGVRDSAYAIWTKAIRMNPKSETNYRIISNYLIQNRAYDKAVEVLREGKLHSKNPNIFSFELANLLSVFMKYSDAATEYCEIVQRNPRQLISVKSKLSTVISRDIAFNETLESVKKYSENNESDAVLELLAYLYSVKGNSDIALKIIINLDEKHNEKGNRVFKYAEDSFLQKDYKIANISYNYLLKNYKNSPFNLNVLIGFYRSKFQLLNKKYLPNNNWKTIITHDTAGASEYLNLAKKFKIIAAEKKVQPYYKAEIFYHTGIIYKEKLADYESAKKYFNFIVRNFSNSNYGILSLNKLGEISIIKDDLEAAANYFKIVLTKSKRHDKINNAASYKLAQIKFWNGKFDEALSLLSSVSGSYKDNSANDALELSLVINMLKTDSVSGIVFAKGSLLIEQFKFKKAIKFFESDTSSASQIIIRELAKFKLAELYLAINDYLTAAKYLQRLSDSEISKLYSDKALFLLGKTYLKGLKDADKAKTIFEKLLAKYPNSVYFSQSRKIINSILVKENNTL